MIDAEMIQSDPIHCHDTGQPANTQMQLQVCCTVARMSSMALSPLPLRVTPLRERARNDRIYLRCLGRDTHEQYCLTHG